MIVSLVLLPPLPIEEAEGVEEEEEATEALQVPPETETSGEKVEAARDSIPTLSREAVAIQTGPQLLLHEKRWELYTSIFEIYSAFQFDDFRGCRCVQIVNHERAVSDSGFLRHRVESRRRLLLDPLFWVHHEASLLFQTSPKTTTNSGIISIAFILGEEGFGTHHNF